VRESHHLKEVGDRWGTIRVNVIWIKRKIDIYRTYVCEIIPTELLYQ